MTAQLPLPLAWRAARGMRDFFVSDANREAVTWLDRWSTWPIPVTLLVGPAGSGKSHLAGIFARRANARLWDDADRASSEEALFHAWNAAMDERRPLLLTARCEPGDWHLALADLRSRLAATPQVRIAPPDDRLLEALFWKLFRDRGVEPSPEVARYVLSRVERSFDGVARAVRLLDEEALARARALTVPVAREALLRLAQP